MVGIFPSIEASFDYLQLFVLDFTRWFIRFCKGGNFFFFLKKWGNSEYENLLENTITNQESVLK